MEIRGNSGNGGKEVIKSRQASGTIKIMTAYQIGPWYENSNQNGQHS